MFAKRFFANVYFALRYFANVGAASTPTYSGIPTICPPVTPDWEPLLITDSLILSLAGWDAPAVVDDDLDS